MVIESHYELGRSFRHGIAPVKYTAGWRYINQQDKSIVSHLGNKRIAFAEPFYGALARVTASGYESEEFGLGKTKFKISGADWVYINTKGEKIWPKSEAIPTPEPIQASSAFDVFNANWDYFFLSIVYPKGWSAVDVNKITGYKNDVCFVKDKDASHQLFGDKKSAGNSLRTIRLITQDNVIIDVGIHPGGGSDYTPEFAFNYNRKPALKDPRTGEIKTYTNHDSPVARRIIQGTDADGKQVRADQLIIKRWDHIITIFAYSSPEKKSEVQNIVTEMLDNMNVVDKK